MDASTLDTDRGVCENRFVVADTERRSSVRGGNENIYGCKYDCSGQYVLSNPKPGKPALYATRTSAFPLPGDLMSRTKKAVEMVEFFLQWSFIVPGIFLCHIRKIQRNRVTKAVFCLGCSCFQQTIIQRLGSLGISEPVRHCKEQSRQFPAIVGQGRQQKCTRGDGQFSVRSTLGGSNDRGPGRGILASSASGRRVR